MKTALVSHIQSLYFKISLFASFVWVACGLVTGAPGHVPHVMALIPEFSMWLRFFLTERFPFDERFHLQILWNATCDHNITIGLWSQHTPVQGVRNPSRSQDPCRNNAKGFWFLSFLISSKYFVILFKVKLYHLLSDCFCFRKIMILYKIIT